MKKAEPICNFIKNDKFVFPALHKSSNLPAPGTCPILKNNYTVNSMQVEAEKFPSLPPGKYAVKVFYASEGKILAGYTVKIIYK
jgi:uncharacterized protein (DUF2141 family)